jgi:hypothetical protein
MAWTAEDSARAARATPTIAAGGSRAEQQERQDRRDQGHVDADLPDQYVLQRRGCSYFVDAPKRSRLARAHSPTIVT